MRNTQYFHRSAFTWIELLVVVFAMVVLVGLLLSSCQKVRIENYPLGQTRNNLKQMGLAIHIQAGCNNGKIWVGAKAPPEGGKGGFFVELLPYVDGRGIYKRI